MTVMALMGTSIGGLITSDLKGLLVLASLTVPASLLTVLEVFRGCFTTPSFATLVTGMVAQTGRRTVCGMLVGPGLSRVWSHDRVHYSFSRAWWDLD